MPIVPSMFAGVPCVSGLTLGQTSFDFSSVEIRNTRWLAWKQPVDNCSRCHVSRYTDANPRHQAPPLTIVHCGIINLVPTCTLREENQHHWLPVAGMFSSQLFFFCLVFCFFAFVKIEFNKYPTIFNCEWALTASRASQRPPASTGVPPPGLRKTQIYCH